MQTSITAGVRPFEIKTTNPSRRYDFSNHGMNQTSRLRPHPLNAEIYGDSKPDAALVESIRQHGILNPIVIDREKQILSGTRRWLAAKEIGYTSVPTVVLLHGIDAKDKTPPSDKSKLIAELLLVESNKARIKTEAQKDAEVAALLRIEKELAAARQQAGVRLNSAEGGKAVEKVAATTGESPDTVRKRAAIHAAGVDPAERNKQSTNAVHRELSNREKRRRAFVQQYPEHAGKPNKEIDAEIHRYNFILLPDAPSSITPAEDTDKRQSFMMGKSPDGHPFMLLLNWFHKTLRRGEERQALYCAAQFEKGGYVGAAWNTIETVVSEDIGLANPNLAAHIEVLRRTFDAMTKRSKPSDKPASRLPLTHAILLCCRSEKSRLVDHATIVAFESETKFEAPAWALDGIEKMQPPDWVNDGVHGAGKKNWKTFFDTEDSICENPKVSDPYRNQAVEIRTGAAQ